MVRGVVSGVVRDGTIRGENLPVQEGVEELLLQELQEQVGQGEPLQRVLAVL